MKNKFTCEYCGRRITSEHCPYCGAVNSFDFEEMEKEGTELYKNTATRIIKAILKMWGAALIVFVILAVIGAIAYFVDAQQTTEQKFVDDIHELTGGDVVDLDEGSYTSSDNIVECSESPELRIVMTDDSEIRLTLPCSYKDLAEACELADEYYVDNSDKRVNIAKSGLTLKPHRTFRLQDLNEIIEFTLYNDGVADKSYEDCVIDEVHVRCYRTWSKEYLVKAVYFDGHLMTQGSSAVVNEVGEPRYMSSYSDGDLSITFKTYYGGIYCYFKDNILESMSVEHKAGERIYD